MSFIQEPTSDTVNSCHTSEVPITGTQNGALGGELQSPGLSFEPKKLSKMVTVDPNLS